MLTVAISTHEDYDPYLKAAVESAKKHADQVIVYDDGGMCTPQGVEHVNLPKSGSPVPARIRAIQDCETSHLLHLDADDVLLARPEFSGDISFGDILLMDRNVIDGTWVYSNRPRDYKGCVDFMRETQRIAIPIAKAVFRLDWLREHDLTWYEWDGVVFGEDARTLIEYMKHEPDVRFIEKPYYGYRRHAKQMTNDDLERHKFEIAMSDYLRGLDV